ncbi:MAG: site-specific integrase [Clostridiales bacterium]|nr:site-specific integrase [Clostridiales bacterium]
MEQSKITNQMIAEFEYELRNDEKSELTVEKYLRDVRRFIAFSSGKLIDKGLVLAYKAELEKEYAVASANSMIASINAFFRFAGWLDLCVKQFKVQRKTFCNEEKELTKAEYVRLCRTAEEQKNERLNPNNDYDCSTYKLSIRGTKPVCCSHHISTKALRELILFTIRTVSKYAITNKEDFVERVRKASVLKQDAAAKEKKRKLNRDKRRFDELDILYKKLYETYALGKITEERFEALSKEYENEQKEIKTVIVEAETEISVYDQDTTNINGFMELIRKYTDLRD